MGILTKYTALVIQVQDDVITGRKMENDHLKIFKESLKEICEHDWQDVQEFLLACVKSRDYYVMREFAAIVVDKKKLINWKDHEEIFKNVFEDILKYGALSVEGTIRDDHCYSHFMDKFIPLVKSNQLLKKHMGYLKDIVKAALSSEDNSLMSAYIGFREDIPYTQHTEWTLTIFDLIYEKVQEFPEMKESNNWSRCVSGFMAFVFRDSILNPKQAVTLVNHVAKLFIYCKDQEWEDPDDSGKRTVHHQICQDILENYLNSHNGKREILSPCFTAIKELWECVDPILQRDANNVIIGMPGGMLVDFDEAIAEQLIDKYLSGEEAQSVIGIILQIYTAYPDKFGDKLEGMAEAMEGAPPWCMSTTISIFVAVGKEYPEKVSDNSLKQLIDTLEFEATYGIALNALVPIAEKYPEKFEIYEEKVEASMYKFKLMGLVSSSIFVHMSNGSEEKTEKYMALLIKASKAATESMHKYGFLFSLRQMGSDFPHILAKYEEYIKSLFNDAILKEQAQGLINVIYGRSLAAVSQEVKEAHEDIENLDERVTNTGENVENLSREVDESKVKVIGLSSEVKEQEERLGELEDVVEETVEKVDEIDKKTLSHAPKWSRDVALLLNINSDHDWRLLASRLGYTNDDIRNWATQPNPCLSMFDEWFATNKTREATHAILKILEETNRTDAAMIVENALKQTEAVVEDGEVDYVTPPPVFISYQWGVQEEVKLLKQHLEMAGFQCWMDIGQMGGGDKLFEKIDTGIRAAKIIICCVTEKYAKSPNCNREVNLSVNLGKPIIPLLMDKIAWPPAGSMGPIFGEYLFIRFFARPGETAGDIRYWPTAKFQELLMQLRYSVVPDESSISDPYKDWWSPPEEIIHIKPKDTNNVTTAIEKSKAQDSGVGSPDVFISYQWGKQPQIKALYRKLTLMGYSCWLDIMQMGGGDSLYDKIDKGVRGCKMVLSCVTQKYSLSANCRREVSLADALKKPIVPMVLEKITWPPEGPMSMVFTQLLYIDFCKPDATVQHTWDCPQMGELIRKMNSHIPSMTYNMEKLENDEEPTGSENRTEESAKNKEIKDSKQERETERCVVQLNEETEKRTEISKINRQEDPARTENNNKKEDIGNESLQNAGGKGQGNEMNGKSNSSSHTEKNPQQKDESKKSSSCIIL